MSHKILITCRANAINEKDHDLFAPAQGELQKAYVTPLNYSEEDSLEENIRNYLKLHPSQYTVDDYITLIQQK
jgi:hypothetical protein